MKKINDPILTQQIIKMYVEDKMSMRKISQVFQMSDSTVKRILVENGIDTTKRNLGYDIKKDLFSKIQNEEDAYWLGFMYADGNVKDKGNNISFELAEKDKDSVEKFRQYCGVTKELHKHTLVRGERTFISYCCNFSDAEIKQNLINLGCVPRKSLILKCPTEEQVPQDLFHHFMRGYSDGDGYLRWNCADEKRRATYVIIGTEDFLQGVVKRMNWEGLCIVRPDNNSRNFRLEAYQINNVYKIMQDIYKDSTIYMPRKHKAYLEAQVELQES